LFSKIFITLKIFQHWINFWFYKEHLILIVCEELKIRGSKLKKRWNGSFLFKRNFVSLLVLYFSPIRLSSFCFLLISSFDWWFNLIISFVLFFFIIVLKKESWYWAEKKIKNKKTKIKSLVKWEPFWKK